MKKNYILTLLLTFSLTAVSFGQEMILNGGLENWTDDTNPADWSKAESITKSTEAHSGTFSAVRDGGSGTKDLAQTITGIIAGNSYTISLWYKVTAGDEQDARIWCTWLNGSTTVYHGETEATDVLRGPGNGYFNNNGGVWTKHEVTVTAPAGVDGFYFEVRSYSNSTTYWDDLSFVNNGVASVKNNAIEGFATYPNPVANNKFVLTSSSSDQKEIAIFNILGKKVFTSNVSGVKATVDVSTISSGIYILKVTEDGKTATKKLVIK